MAKATASTKTNTVAKSAPKAESKLRENVIAYLTARLKTSEAQLVNLETVISDTGSEAQRVRAEQAAHLRSRIVELQSDILAITYMAE
jgi:hypothetical protein